MGHADSCGGPDRFVACGESQEERTHAPGHVTALSHSVFGRIRLSEISCITNTVQCTPDNCDDAQGIMLNSSQQQTDVTSVGELRVKTAKCAYTP